MKYRIIEKGFPIEIAIYKENVSLGMIEVYRTGKIYFKDFPIKSGMSIKDIQKAMKIVRKELRKQKIRTWLKSS